MKKPYKLLILVTIVIIIALILIFTLSHKNKNSFSSSPIPVYVSKPTIIPLSNKVSVIASISAKQQTYVTSKNDGYIKNILFNEGQQVKANAPLIQLDTTKTKSQFMADQTAYLIQKSEYEEDLKLYQKGLISKDDMDADHAKYASDQAQLIADQKLLQEMTIRAPFSGTLGAKTISIGDYITAAQKLVLLVDRNDLLAEYNLPERYAPALKVGQTVVIKNNSLPNQTFTGKIEYIAPDVDTATRTIAIHASINDPNHELLPGQYVTVSQQLSKARQALFIPEQSIIESLSGASVYIVTNDDKAKKVSVQLGTRYKGLIEVTNGLSINDQVITAGQNQLKANMPVKIVSKP